MLTYTFFDSRSVRGLALRFALWCALILLVGTASEGHAAPPDWMLHGLVGSRTGQVSHTDYWHAPMRRPERWAGWGTGWGPQQEAQDSLPPELYATMMTPEQLAAAEALRPQLEAYVETFLSGAQQMTVDTVPVRAYLIRRSDGTGGLSQEEWQEALAYLNEVYAGGNLYFKECLWPEEVHSDYFYTAYLSDLDRLKLRQGIDKVLNIFFFDRPVNGLGIPCGFAPLPFGSGTTVNIVTVQISCEDPKKALARLVGRALGLYYTHGKSVNCSTPTNEWANGLNCTTAGDDICDTPADPNLAGPACQTYLVDEDCNYTGTALDFNGQPFAPDTRNIMSFSPPACREYLTPMQLATASFHANYTLQLTCSTNDACESVQILTNCSGSLSDGSGGANYAPGQNCRWLIAPPGASAVTLNFTAFDTRPANGVVRVYDGTGPNAPLLGTFSGNTLPPSVTGLSGSLFVSFISSGAALTGPGWQAEYTCTYPGPCGGQLNLSSCTGDFTDGSLSADEYEGNLDCSWLIAPLDASSVTLTFTAFDTEAGADFVRVYDGANAQAPLLGEFSGSALPPALTGTSGRLFVQFATDGHHGGQTGWAAHYACVTPGLCNGLTVLTDYTGTLTDGSGGQGLLAPNMNCSWLIAPPGAQTVTLQFIEYGLLYDDYIRVYNGTSASAQLIGSYTGSSLPSSVTASSGTMFVRFTTNDLLSGWGWSATYSTLLPPPCTGHTVMNGCNGQFSQYHPQGGFEDARDCTWLLMPTGAGSVTLNFPVFDTEAGQEVIRVYDGDHPNAPLLGEFSGNEPPPSLTSTSGRMLVRYTTQGGGSTGLGWRASYTCSYPGPCSGTITLNECEGEFSDGTVPNANYDNNRDCRWLIAPHDALSVTLNFVSFQVINDGFDRVVVYDGPTIFSPVLGTFFGHNLPPSLTSSSPQMLVRFLTNQLGSALGWQATYTCTEQEPCSGHVVLTNCTGDISDYNGVDGYAPNLECSWLIAPPGAEAVTLAFTMFDTEEGADFVRVYDGADANAPLLGEFSGSALPASVTSTAGSLFLQFTSNGTVSGRGWDALYACAYPGLCGGTTTLLSATGTLSDGSGPNANYQTDMDCAWLIAPPNAASVTLTFTHLMTESFYDDIRVYDGPNANSPLLGTFSGAPFNLPSVTASSGKMFVRFTSDEIIVQEGWTAVYTSTPITPCGGYEVLDSCNGFLTDNSGLENYENDSDCSWLIAPFSADNITLTFTSFDTEAGGDFVRVYDGADENAPLLGEFSGMAIPPSITSSSREMFIRFTTNGSVRRPGWRATYSCASPGLCSGYKVLTDCEGRLSDGSNENNYANNMNCSWLIAPPDAAEVTLTFLEFQTSGLLDIVRVYNGADANAPLLGAFSGSTIPSPLTGTFGQLFVQFTTSSLSGTRPGWKATYTCTPLQPCEEATVLAACDGLVSDGSGSAPYEPGVDCTWLIAPPDATEVALRFTAFDTEAGADTLWVYDGADADAPLLGAFSGADMPPVLIGTSGQLFLHFASTGTEGGQGWAAQYLCQQAGLCNGYTTILSCSGVISDGSGPGADYQNNMNCSWLIAPPGATEVRLSFLDFSTATSSDLVQVYDGINSNAPLLGSFSGNNLPAPVIGSSGKLFVRFTSDSAGTRPGWSAEYTCSRGDCEQQVVLTECNGLVQDGSGTSSYKPDLDCTWLIAPPDATEISLRFTAFDTELGADIVRVYDGEDTNAPLLGEFSGSALPPIITATSGRLFLHFMTNGSVAGQGWTAEYFCARSGLCNGLTTLMSCNGLISEGSGPAADYANSMSCSWLIAPPGATSIRLTFNDFNVIIGDEVTVYDGGSTNSPSLGTFFGTSIAGGTLVSTSDKLFVRFLTNATNTGPGWSAQYACEMPASCAGHRTLQASSGTLSSHTGPGNYANDASCTWLIDPPGAAAVTLSFTAFQTQAGVDRVRVYDGANASAPLIGVFSGQTLPSAVTGHSGRLFVHFESDGAVTASGWKANYTTTPSAYCGGTTLLTNCEGVFSDGGGSLGLVDGMNCSWRIAPPGANSVTLSFEEFRLRSCCDKIRIYDGSSASAPLLREFSGNFLPPSVTSSSGTLFVQFITDGGSLNTNNWGWTARYTCSTAGLCSPSTASLFSPIGSFSDRSGPAHYGNNMSCSWRITPAGATAIRLSFSEFDTEANHDVVWVYDGIDANAPLLGAFSGGNLPPEIISNTGQMFVRFTTNGSVTRPGWTANYISTNAVPCTSTTIPNLNSCYEILSDGSGAGHYNNSSSCQWRIDVGTTSSIRFQFTEFDTEENKDFVLIHDGSDSSAPLLGRFSGQTLPPAIVSTSGKLFVRFITNNSVTRPGWKAYYTCIPLSPCFGTTTLTAPSGTLTDGSGNDDFGAYWDCGWLIAPPGASSVTLSFSQFNVGLNPKLYIYDGPNANAQLLGVFSGSTLPPTFTSSSGALYVRFDSSVGGRPGWRAHYTANYPALCQGLTTLTNCSGTFTNGGSPIAPYANNTNCSWLINPPNAASITLHFTDFDTETGADVVRVYDGPNANATLIGSFSGNNIPPLVTSTSGQLFVRFTTNGSETRPGWIAHYTCTTLGPCQGHTTLTACQGEISDGSDPNINYSNNMNCSWLISPIGATQVTLNFAAFNTEAGNDWVRVYDGVNANAPLIGSFSGTTLPPSVTGHSGKLFVRFTTNGSVTRPGWSASYTCIYGAQPVVLRPSADMPPLTATQDPLDKIDGAAQATPPGASQGQETDRLLVFPNPAHDAFTVQMPPNPAVMELRDAKGRLLQRTDRPLGPLLEVDATPLPKGLLWVVVLDRQGRRWHARVVLW